MQKEEQEQNYLHCVAKNYWPKTLQPSTHCGCSVAISTKRNTTIRHHVGEPKSDYEIFTLMQSIRNLFFFLPLFFSPAHMSCRFSELETNAWWVYYAREIPPIVVWLACKIKYVSILQCEELIKRVRGHWSVWAFFAGLKSRCGADVIKDWLHIAHSSPIFCRQKQHNNIIIVTFYFFSSVAYCFSSTLDCVETANADNKKLHVLPDRNWAKQYQTLIKL